MRLNMHEDTPTHATETIPKVLLALACGCGVLVLGLLVFALVYYVQQYAMALAMVLLVLLVIGMCWMGILDLKKSYIEVVENQITVVEYNMGIKKVKCFSMDDIKYITYSNGNAFVIRGTRNRYAEYIVLRGVRRKYLFKVFDCPKTREIFQQGHCNKP